MIATVPENYEISGITVHSCHYCPYNTPSIGNYKRHLLVHTGERPYECKICHFRFNQTNSLKRHIQRKHMFNSNVA